MSILPPDPVYCLKSDMGHVHSLCFQKINDSFTTTLLAATEKGFVYFWDLETNRSRHKQEMGESIQAVHSIEYDVITQEKSGTVKLWKVKKSQYSVDKTFECSGGFCKSIVFNDQIILPQENSSLESIDLNTFEKTKSFVPDKERLGSVGNIMCLEAVEIKGNSYILAGYESGDVILFDYNTSKTCAHTKLKEFITSISFDSQTCRGVVGNSSDVLEIIQIDPSLDISVEHEVKLSNKGTNVVKLRPDMKLFAAGGWDGRVRLCSWKTWRVLVVLTEHKKSVSDVKFSPCPVPFWDSKIMAVTGAEGKISLWNIYNNYN